MRVAIALLMMSVGAARAEEPHLDFLDQLRSNGLADIAIAYLDQITPSADAGLRPRLTLERAKSLAALAVAPDETRRQEVHFDAARQEFERYIDGKPSPRLVADARCELARMLIRQGQARVKAARRIEVKSEKQDALARARATFTEAARELGRAEQSLKRMRPNQETDREQIAAKLRDIDFQSGLLLVNRGLTFGASTAEQLRARSDDLVAARKLFLRLAEDDRHGVTALMAYLEAGRIWMELDNAQEARRVFESIARTDHPGTLEAIRAARYQLLLLADKDSNNKSRAADVIRGCDEWLNRYRASTQTPEGLGVQFLLATNLIQQAQAGIRAAQAGGRIQVEPAARNALGRAERILKDLAHSESEYSRKAGILRGDVLAVLMDERLAAGVSRLLNFDECFLAAQVKYAKSLQLTENREAGQRRSLVLEAVAALQKGLGLIRSTDDPNDIFTARLMLAYLLLINGDPYSAAVLAEHQMLSNSNSPRGAKAAMYALQAYSAILAESKARSASAEEVATYSRRLRALADHVLSNEKWRDEPETDAGRFQLANLAFEGGQFREAAAWYGQIRDTFPGLAATRFRQGAAAQLAQAKDQPGTPAEKKQLLMTAISALERLPEPIAGSSAETALYSIQAKLQLGQLLLLGKDDAATFAQIESIAERLAATLKDTVASSDPARPQIEADVLRTRVAGVAGQAYHLIRAGKLDDARGKLRPVVEQISRSADAWRSSTHSGESWHQAMMTAMRETTLLHTRIDIIEGRTDAMKSSLAVYAKLTDPAKPADAFDGLIRIVVEMKRDLDAVRDTGDAERRKKLENGLVGFLDEVARAPALSMEGRLYLAQGYVAIDRPDRAIELLKAIASPAPDDETATRTFRAGRLTLAKAHRLAKQFGPAKDVLREIMAGGPQRGWGADNSEVRKEAIALLEDEGNYVGAARMAAEEQNKLLRGSQDYTAKSRQVRQLRDEAKAKPDAAAGLNEKADQLDSELQRLVPVRERFFEFYHLEARAIARNARKSGDPKSIEALGRLATRLVKLEQGQPDLGGDASRARLRSLLAEEPLLAEKYQAAGGKTLLETPRP